MRRSLTGGARVRRLLTDGSLGSGARRPDNKFHGSGAMHTKNEVKLATVGGNIEPEEITGRVIEPKVMTPDLLESAGAKIPFPDFGKIVPPLIIDRLGRKPLIFAQAGNRQRNMRNGHLDVIMRNYSAGRARRRTGQLVIPTFEAAPKLRLHRHLI